MEPDSMELKVISCKDLKAFNFFQKLNIYVVVSIVNEEDSSPTPTPTPSPTKNNNNNNYNEKKKKKHQKQQKQKTPIDREGDGNPEWNHVMRFDLKEIFSSSSSSSLLLEFDLLCEGTILGDKTIGRVRVPFEDLIKEFNGAVRFVSYQVRTTDGIPNGVLDFSFKSIFIHINHSFNFGNEALPAVAVGVGSFNFNGGGGGGGGADADVPFIYPPMPSTNYYPPLTLTLDGSHNNNPSSSPETHNPSPEAESYYPKIDQFPVEIHYATTHEIHSSSPPSEYHNNNPISPPLPEVYYPSPPPPPPPPGGPSPYNTHDHHSLPQPQPQPQPQVAYYYDYPPPPPTPTLPLFYHHHHTPPGPPPPTQHPYGRVEFNTNYHPAAYGYPNHWGASLSTTPPTPIHW